MKKSLVWHPFLFAVYPALFLYSHNVLEASYENVVIVILWNLLFVLLVYTLSYLYFRDVEKAAFIASIATILFFSYGHVYNILYGINIFGGRIRHRYLLAVFTFILIYEFYSILKSARPLTKRTKILNLFAIILVVITLFRTVFSISSYTGNRIVLVEDKGSSLSSHMEKPDIFFFIMDGYGGNGILKEVYSLDNSQFNDFLKQAGFIVREQSKSNYAWTILSLSSILNMNYINDIIHIENADSEDTSTLSQTLRDNKVSAILKLKGYTLVNTWTPFGNVGLHRPDIFIAPSRYYSKFELNFLRSTMVLPFMDSLYELFFPSLEEYKLTVIGELPKLKIKEPIFAVIHLPTPHECFDNFRGSIPSIYNRSKTNLSHEQFREQCLGLYASQVEDANTIMKDVIIQLLKRPKKQVIIVLSDHGPMPWYDLTYNLNSVNPSQRHMKERLSNFCAIYMPGVQRDDQIIERLTPVNIFRVIFNKYLGSNYPLLERKNFYSPKKFPFKFTDMTDK